MADEVLGSAVVEIEADTRDLDESLARDVERAAQDAGDAIEATLGAAFENVVSAASTSADAMGETLSGSADQIAESFESTGESITDTLSRSAEESATALGAIGEDSADGIASSFEGVGDAIASEFEAAAEESDASLQSIGEGAADSITSQFSGVGDSISQEMESAGRSGEDALGGIGDGAIAATGHIGGLITAAIGLGTVLGLSKFALDAQAYGDQLENIETLIQNQGKAAKFTTIQLEKMARDRSLKLGIDTRDILEAEAKLLRFGNLTQENLGRATDSAADLATIMGTDVVGAANLLGRAIANPTTGLRLLSKQVGFTAEEQERLKKAIEGTKDPIKQQGILLDAVAKKIGGAAERSADGTDKIKVAFSALTREIGNPLIDAVDKIAPSFQTALLAPIPGIQALGELFKGLVEDNIEPFAKKAAEKLAAISSALISPDGVLRVKSFGEAFDKITETLDIKPGSFDRIVGRIIDGIGNALDKIPAKQIADHLIRLTTRAIQVLAEESGQIVASILPVLVKALPSIAIGIGEGLIQAFRDNPLPMVAIVAAMGLPLIGPLVTTALVGILGAIPIAGPLLAAIVKGLAGVTALISTAISGTVAASVGPGISAGLAGISAEAGVAGAAATAAGASIGTLILVGIGTVLTGVALGFLINKAIEEAAPGVNRALEDFGAYLVAPSSGFHSSIAAGLERFGGFLYDTSLRIFGGFVTGALSAMTGLPPNITAIFGRILDSLGVFSDGFIGRARSLWGRAADAFLSGIGSLANIVATLPNRILNALGPTGNILYDAGRAIIRGLIRGIESMLGPVGAAISKVAKIVSDHMPHSPAKEGPLRDNPMDQAGRKIIEQLSQGLIDSLPLVSRQANKIAATISGINPVAKIGVETIAYGSSAAAIVRGSTMPRLQSDAFSTATSAATSNSTTAPITVQDLKALVDEILVRARPITVNEVAQDPEATAQAVAVRVGSQVRR